MKLLKTGFILLAAMLVLSNCKQPAKVKDSQPTNTKGETGTVEVGIFDAVKLKDQIVGTIKDAPKPRELAEFFSEGGFTYMHELTVPLENIEKYMTAIDQSLALGLYKLDLIYAKAFDRMDVVLPMYENVNKLIGKLGLEYELSSIKGYDERIRQNSANTDSLNAIIPDLINQMGRSYTAGEHPGVYGLTYVAGNIEGLYILTQVALMAKDNSKLLAFLGNQKERIQANYMLLEYMAADESVTPLFEKMKPVLDFFNKNQSFASKQLAELAPMIAEIRADIMK